MKQIEKNKNTNKIQWIEKWKSEVKSITKIHMDWQKNILF